MTVSPMASSWSPPDGSDVVVERAHICWDAVRIRGPRAERVLERLGEQSGAVIEDRFGQTFEWYWLIPPGAAEDWHLRDKDVVVLGAACFVGVPPRDKTGEYGVRWLIPWDADRGLTDAQLLRAAIGSA